MQWIYSLKNEWEFVKIICYLEKKNFKYHKKWIEVEIYTLNNVYPENSSLVCGVVNSLEMF